MAWRFSGSAAAAGLAMSSVARPAASRSRAVPPPAAHCRSRSCPPPRRRCRAPWPRWRHRRARCRPRCRGRASALRVSSGYSVLTAEPPGQGGQLGQARAGESAPDRQHDPGRVRGGLGVVQLAEGHHLAPPLLDAVVPGDTEVEQAVGHVDGDLLGPQDPHLADAGVADAWPGRPRRTPALTARSASSKSCMVARSSEPLGRTRRSMGEIFADRRRRSVRAAPRGQAVAVPPPYDARTFPEPARDRGAHARRRP